MNIAINEFKITSDSPTTYKVVVKTKIQFKSGEEKRRYRVLCLLKAQDTQDNPPGSNAKIGNIGSAAYPGNNPPSQTINLEFAKSFANAQLNEDSMPGAEDEVFALVLVTDIGTGKIFGVQSKVIKQQF